MREQLKPTAVPTDALRQKVIDLTAWQGPSFTVTSVLDQCRRQLGGRDTAVRNILLALREAGEITSDSSGQSWNPVALHRRLRRADPQLAPDLKYHWGSDGRRVWQAVYRNDEELLRHERSLSTLGLGWLRDFDGDWLSSRSPAIRQALVKSAHPGCWLMGCYPRAFHAILPGFANVAELLCTGALVRGELQIAAAIIERERLDKLSYDLALQCLRGDWTGAAAALAQRVGKRKTATRLGLFPSLLLRLAALRAGNHSLALDERMKDDDGWIRDYLRLVCHALNGSDQPGARALANHASGEGARYLLAACLERVAPTDDAFRARRAPVLARWREQGLERWAEQLELATSPWTESLAPRAPWEHWLDALKQQGEAVEAARKPAPPTPPKRSRSTTVLGWKVLKATVAPVKLDGKGGETELALKTLVQRPPEYLTEQDRIVLGKCRVGRYGDYDLSSNALRSLIGHPHLLFEGSRCVLKEATQSLRVQRGNEGYELRLHPRITSYLDFALETTGPGEVTFYAAPPVAPHLVPLLSDARPVPFDQLERLKESLAPWVASLPLTFGTGVAALVQQSRTGQNIALRLKPEREGLSFQWMAYFESGCPALPLLTGPAQESVRWQGQVYQVSRDFAAERHAFEAFRSACPRLPATTEGWLELTQALELLEAGPVLPLEWPEGNPWRVRAVQRPLRVQVLERTDWFELQGQLELDEELTLELARALELARSARGGRFVPLGPDQWLVLHEELRAKLEALDELSDEQGKLSPLAIPSLAELDLKLETGKEFQRVLERFDAASSYRPRIPSTLQAELRDYQVDGFRWLAQRLKAGAGACLADDMGLGKTVQSLALLLKETGPHLIVCPTSVVSAWTSQIERFAPTLECCEYDGSLPSETHARTVVICTYRRLLNDQETLSRVRWGVAVLDEAQSIKNPDSKTARACFTLDARGRVATTGTPVENRLSELWSIFRFLNPGLLGTLPSFRRRFEGESSSRSRLRRLVAPFLLRRTKAQVLSELPARTELTLAVELSPVERSLYEQLRLEAQAQATENPLALLASLTRLRQACCHPRLLLPESDHSSAKLEAFHDLLEELREGGHRALVFSQFTSVLDLVEPTLRSRGIPYLRLDGSTPAAERRRRVEQFQSGEGDLFLISLKAGGTGLNLTGADYVVHLDPWWNPAAEDQASDRAHRIGQTRPVTIYRLIARDTVEEKVLQLHGRKRRLAQEVLDGREEAASISAAELRELLHEG